MRTFKHVSVITRWPGSQADDGPETLNHRAFVREVGARTAFVIKAREAEYARAFHGTHFVVQVF